MRETVVQSLRQICLSCAEGNMYDTAQKVVYVVELMADRLQHYKRGASSGFDHHLRCNSLAS